MLSLARSRSHTCEIETKQHPHSTGLKGFYAIAYDKNRLHFYSRPGTSSTHMLQCEYYFIMKTALC